jgi:hypothetical protein
MTFAPGDYYMAVGKRRLFCPKVAWLHPFTNRFVSLLHHAGQALDYAWCAALPLRPRYKVMPFAYLLYVLHLEFGRLEKTHPLGFRKCPVVAGISQPLKCIHIPGRLFILWQHMILNQQDAAPL